MAGSNQPETKANETKAASTDPFLYVVLSPTTCLGDKAYNRGDHIRLAHVDPARVQSMLRNRMIMKARDWAGHLMRCEAEKLRLRTSAELGEVGVRFSNRLRVALEAVEDKHLRAKERELAATRKEIEAERDVAVREIRERGNVEMAKLTEGFVQDGPEA